MRFVISIHLLWKRVEIALVALLVPFLLIESGIANGWIYAGGSFTDPWGAAIGLIRGFFLEVLIYVAASQALIMLRKRNKLGASLMAGISIVGILVSAFNNIEWVLSGHQLAGLFGSAGGSFVTASLLVSYECLMGLLLPVSLGLIALAGLDDFFQHAINQDYLDNMALKVEERIMHRTAFLKGQRKQKAVIQEAYEEIAADRADGFIEQAREGDLSFGAEEPGRVVNAEPQAQLQSPRASRERGHVWPADEEDEYDELDA